MAPAAPGLLRLLDRNFRYPLKVLLDADIGKLHTQRIGDRQLTDSCERRNSVSKCTPEWDEKVSFLAKVRHQISVNNQVCDGAGDLTVALWRFASLRLAPVSIRMCPLGFPQNTSHVP